MFGTFRKHSTALWGVIIAAMAVSLVVWTGNRGGNGRGGGAADLGVIGGKKVSQDDFVNAAREAKLQYFLSRGEWPDASAERLGFNLNSQAYQRLFLERKMQELGVHVSDEAVAKEASRYLQSFARQAGSPSMQLFEQKVLAPGGLNVADFERFLRHNLGIQQIVAIMGLSGKLVTPQEARTIYERENQDLSAQAVFFNASNYLASITATPAQLSEFYSNQMVRYRLPDRVQVSYVQFQVTNFWAEGGLEMNKMTNLDLMIDAEYQRRGTNFYSGMTPEKAKASIREEIHEQFATMAARRRASEFADPLVSADGVKPEALAARAKEQGLAVSVTAPFDRSSVPAGLDARDNFTKAAFDLREDEPIAGPLLSGDSVYVIARNKQLPSEVQSFATVKTQVEQDFKLAQALQAARRAAAEFETKATNGLAQGKAFTSLCAEAKASPVLLPPFSLSSRSLPEVEDHISLQQFKQVVFNTAVGHVSPAVPTMEGSVVVYVQAKLPIDQTKLEKDLPDFIKLLRQARESEAFEAWFQREASQALAGIPMLRQAEVGSPTGAN